MQQNHVIKKQNEENRTTLHCSRQSHVSQTKVHFFAARGQSWQETQGKAGREKNGPP